MLSAMIRRRLMLAAGAAFLLGTGWWLSFNRLTPDEQRLVGTWRLGPRRPAFITLTLAADHRCERAARYTWGTDTTPGRWWAQDGRIFIDLEPNPVKRALRPVLVRIGLPVTPVGSTAATDFDPTGGPDRPVRWTPESGD
jgi:hypothetical protein